MAQESKTQDTTVEKVDINIDELFAAAPDADAIVTPETKPKNIFSKKEGADLDFIDKKEEKVEEPVAEEPAAEEPEVEETKEEPKAEEKKEEPAATLDDVLDAIDEEPEAEETETKKRGRKKLEGIADVFNKLIKSEKIVPFDDDKPLAEYSAKDWEELIEANMEEKANQVRKETPAKFFESLPDELKIAARYVFDGGKSRPPLFLPPPPPPPPPLPPPHPNEKDELPPGAAIRLVLDLAVIMFPEF